VGKKKLRKQFSSLFKFSWSLGGGEGAGSPLFGGSLRLSLVLQSDAADRAPDMAPASGNLSPVFESSDWVAGAANALAVVVEIQEESSTVSLRLGGKVGAASTLDSVVLGRRPLPDTGHWLLVEVRQPPSSSCGRHF
jgi:hypothetical protein